MATLDFLLTGNYSVLDIILEDFSCVNPLICKTAPSAPSSSLSPFILPSQSLQHFIFPRGHLWLLFLEIHTGPTVSHSNEFWAHCEHRNPHLLAFCLYTCHAPTWGKSYHLLLLFLLNIIVRKSHEKPC